MQNENFNNEQNIEAMSNESLSAGQVNETVTNDQQNEQTTQEETEIDQSEDTSVVDTARLHLSVVKGPSFSCEQPSTKSDQSDISDEIETPELLIKKGCFRVYYIRNLDFDPTRKQKYSESLDLIGLTSNRYDGIRTMSFLELHSGELTVMLDKLGGLLTIDDLQIKAKPGSIDYLVSGMVDDLADQHVYTAALFKQTRLYEIPVRNPVTSEIENKYAFLYDGGMLFNGEVIKSIRQHNPKTSGEEGNLDIQRGDPSAYKQALQRHLKDKPHLQLIFGYILSGLVRQALHIQGRDLGETGAVMCITGDPGTGKTSTTKGLKESLFGVNGNMTANATAIKTGYTVRDSGICPLLIDDTSVKKGSPEALVESLYHLSNGSSRSTCFAQSEVVYAPVIQSREKSSSMTKQLKTIYRLDGFIYRVFEIEVSKGDLATSAEEADQIRALSSDFSGQAIEFIKVLLNEHINAPDKLLSEYMDMMKYVLDIKNSNVAYEELEDRIANRAAVILLTLKIAGEAYDLDIDLRGATIVLLDAVLRMKTALNKLNPGKYLDTIMDFYEYSSKYPLIEQPLVKGVKMFDPSVNIGFVDDKMEYLWIPYNLMGLVVEQDWASNKTVNPWHLPMFTQPKQLKYNTLKDLKKNDQGAIKNSDSPAVKTIYQSWINMGISEVRTGELKNVKTIRGVNDIPFFKINIKRLKSELGRYGSPDKSDLEEQHAPVETSSGTSGEAATESSIDLL